MMEQTIPSSVTRFFRLNCSQQDQELVLSLVQEEGFEFQGIPGRQDIKTLKTSPFSMGNSLANYFGYIYIQDISSMLPVMLLAPDAGSTVLDLCASPGSKTSQLANLVGPGGLIVANEPNPSRLATLRSNLRRLNLVNVITSGYQGQDFPCSKASFDYILLDAPCSGWGTVLKNPRVLDIWTQDRLGALKALQKSLITSASRLLAPGGRLVYSTCTTNEQENEEQVLLALDDLPLKAVDQEVPFSGSALGLEVQRTGPGMIRVRGSRTGGQDFFMALLTSDRSSGSCSDQVPQQALSRQPVAFDLDMRHPGSGNFYDFSGNVYFVPDRAWSFIKAGLKVQGTHVGRKKGKGYALSPRMRIFLPSDGIKTGFCTSDPGLVRRLINGQSQAVSGSVQGGLQGFYWNGLGLGWLKIKGRRLLWSDR
ncbi:RsmB/NOP family class I SAM-dependent RNA methyltransferase [Desulfonatronovibrio hydrogenovorans]|uniref:RsmB/NOP family class I SAM-dependent RNA methyltransferase n=1 Tax=Desulfonatronovibrio hydrogenovorans TaxID=53245 RepID=UPI00048F7840|nr:RsmB/NOP family class I SAM-dependent RNA methyltransferase [Desulfonatronovibrio hydrogenovorans]